jgi:hypothetical protein
MVDECFAYDDVLRKNGHFVGGEALESAQKATTLRWKKGKAAIIDGPYAETKEQLGGILVLEATGHEPSHRVDVETPWCKSRILRDPSGRGLVRNNKRK